MFKYKMVQIPPNVIINSRKTDKDSAAAIYLEDVVNNMAGRGWEFYRIDSIGVAEAPGCSGKKDIGPTVYYVITFRMPVN
ncbi:TPA: DUF4177 domain-containing protein [Escherichia coli]|nr:DUF4177 domain-containing protein [Escherichia coli]EGB0933349.1 DUF4177 domain-containing protein [Escherichia coli]VEW07853.1 conserved hypothetical protein [Escherichia coli]HAX5140185.1 DUF4177 domain-containing protein [Escherichia coli]